MASPNVPDFGLRNHGTFNVVEFGLTNHGIIKYYQNLIQGQNVIKCCWTWTQKSSRSHMLPKLGLNIKALLNIPEIGLKNRVTWNSA